MGNIWLILLISAWAVLFVYCVWLVRSSNKANREYNEKMDQHMQEVFPLMRKRSEHDGLMRAKRIHDGDKP